MSKFPSDTKKGKMQIKLVRGCVCDSLTVDGKDEYAVTNRLSERLSGLVLYRTRADDD